MKIDKFVIAIIVVIGIAYLFPQWGTTSSPIPLDTISDIGIGFIFFLYGLKLSIDKLKNGLKNWKLHLLIQASTFLMFPFIVLAFRPFLQTQEQEAIWLAFFFLAALPSTVSSSVVMVSIAKGNIPAAIFNASISGIIGIAVTPLWLGLFMQTTDTDFNFAEMYTKLTLQIILPVFLGIFLQRFLGAFALKHGAKLTLFDKTVILLIVYKSFAESFDAGIFGSVSILDLLVLSVGVLLLFIIVFFLIGFVSKKLNFNEEDQITAQFCGTKKSLVHGTVFSAILFGKTASVGIVLLPLMLFHTIQIVIISVLASNLSRRQDLVQKT